MTGLVLMATATASASPTASFAISGSGSYTVGNSFTVTVSENSGSQEVNAVKAQLQYDASALQVTSLSTGDFTTCPAAPSASGNTISFQCAALGTKLTGVHIVGTITFKALAAQTTSVSTLSSSAIVDANTANQNDWDGVAAAGSYTLTAPVSSQPNPTPTPAPTQGGSTAPSATSKTSTGSTGKATATTNGTAVAGATTAQPTTPTTPAPGSKAASNNPTINAKDTDKKTSKSGTAIAWILLAVATIALLVRTLRKKRQPVKTPVVPAVTKKAASAKVKTVANKPAASKTKAKAKKA